MNDAAMTFTLPDTLLSEAEALQRLGDRRTTLDGRMMDPKAQIVGEFALSVRVPGHFPGIAELRQQLVTMVQLLDEPAPELPRKEDISVPGPAGDIPARLYSPQSGREALPVLAYFHGGGWVQGDLETHDGLCARLALWSGAMVIAFDYRLAPENKFPAGVEDCVAAYRWLREHSGSLGVDTARVALGGDSAGGNLSAVVCQEALRHGFPVPSFQVLIYPGTDMAMDSHSHDVLRNNAIIPRDRIEWYLEQYFASDADRQDPRASPIAAADLTGQPPALIISGGFDPLRDEARAYGDKLVAAGCDVVYHEYPGQIHAFVSLSKAIPQGLQATREAADYIRRQFGQYR